MAKGKKKRSRKANKVADLKKPVEEKPNPFEIHFNKQKHNVLGRKSKHDRGLPGVAKAKALKKRSETLLKEYKRQTKANKFVDRRLGEYDPTMTLEDKMTARFTAERKKMHKKASIFNLNDEEQLTHYGQTLSEIEKFDDPRSDDEDEDEGKMAAEFMKESHFGGLFTKREESENTNEKQKSRKEWIDQLIADSKKKKFEKQTENEETRDLTEKLDTEWKELRALVSTGKRKDKASENDKLDSYDLAVRELKYESRAKATDRLKTPEELAKDEKDRLEKLEADRLRRMKGITSETEAQTTHRSADDLDSQPIFFKNKNKNKYLLQYKDGKIVSTETEDAPQIRRKRKHKEDENSDSNTDQSQEESDNSEVTEDKEDNEDDSDDEEEDDNYSDIESSDDDKETLNISSESKKDSGKKFLEKLMDTKKMMEEARKELPYTFSAPKKYEDFVQIIEGHNSDDQAVIIERIIKCHHPSLAEGNKERLEIFFAILLQHLNDVASQDHLDMNLIDKLVPFFYDLTHLSPVNAGRCMQEVIMEKYEDFSKRKACFPSFDTFVFFKLVSLLFPTSDFQHCVVTPTLMFMGEILTQCKVKTRQDIARGLFMCNLMLEFVFLSKRFVPEVVNFLRGLVFLAVEKDPRHPIPVIPPFQSVGKTIDLLRLQEGSSFAGMKLQRLSLDELVVSQDIDDHFRFNALWCCLGLIREFARLYEELPLFREIFQPIRSLFQKLPLEKYPPEFQKIVSELEEKWNAPRILKSLVQETKKKQPLKLFEPKIDDNFDGQKHRKGSRQFNEKARLLHKYKREFKGAIREIRRDNTFLAKQQLHEQLERDADRKQKVKALFSSLANQEGDYKKMMKKKKKKMK